LESFLRALLFALIFSTFNPFILPPQLVHAAALVDVRGVIDRVQEIIGPELLSQQSRTVSF
jgi:hypothetical protein